MPWTENQVRYLLSSGSPLSEEQKKDMADELHEEPSLGHRKNGKPGEGDRDVQSHRYDWRKRGRK